MGLEQTLVGIPKVEPIKEHQTIDRYAINEVVLYTYFNPVMDGGITIDLKKSTLNTVILRENFGYGFSNIYLHHNRGLGRMIFIDPLEKLRFFGYY